MNQTDADLDIELKNQFDSEGFVCLRNFLDSKSVSELKAVVDQFICDKVPGLPRATVFYDELGRPESLKQIQKLFELDDYFRRMMFESRFERLASTLLGTGVRGVNMQYFNKPPRTSHPTPPHQDGYYFMLEPNEALTMWLALDSSDVENGTVRYLPGSHLRGLRPHHATGTLGFSQGIADYSEAEKKLEWHEDLQPGDLLVHHALTVHRADRNHSLTRSRRSIGLIYYSRDSVESPEKQRREKDLFKAWAKENKI